MIFVVSALLLFALFAEFERIDAAFLACLVFLCLDDVTKTALLLASRLLCQELVQLTGLDFRGINEGWLEEGQIKGGRVLGCSQVFAFFQITCWLLASSYLVGSQSAFKKGLCLDVAKEYFVGVLLDNKEPFVHAVEKALSLSYIVSQKRMQVYDVGQHHCSQAHYCEQDCHVNECID